MSRTLHTHLADGAPGVSHASTSEPLAYRPAPYAASEHYEEAACCPVWQDLPSHRPLGAAFDTRDVDE